MESSTKVTFTAENKVTLTVVANTGCNKAITIDGTSYTLKDGILEVELAAGKHTITKDDSNVNVYYLKVEE